MRSLHLGGGIIQCYLDVIESEAERLKHLEENYSYNLRSESAIHTTHAEEKVKSCC